MQGLHVDSSAELSQHRPASAPLHTSVFPRAAGHPFPIRLRDEAVMQPAVRAVGVPAPLTPSLPPPAPFPPTPWGPRPAPGAELLQQELFAMRWNHFFPFLHFSAVFGAVAMS